MYLIVVCVICANMVCSLFYVGVMGRGGVGGGLGFDMLGWVGVSGSRIKMMPINGTPMFTSVACVTIAYMVTRGTVAYCSDMIIVVAAR